ncbi:MAG: hydroxyacid-oxoacid transhydrogenase [Polyangiaceae bacterium]
MSCCHYVAEPGFESAFTVDASRVTFGRGAIREVGARCRRLGLRRVALFTDARVRGLALFERARESLVSASIDVVVYDGVRVEPTDESLAEAIAFASEARADGYVSVGGGSVIDTCKAANLYATHPDNLLAYVNAPIGDGRPPPGPLRPHVACPTTSGTGSEVTAIAVFDLLSMQAKTGISSPALRPTEALIDPDATDTLPREVVAASGFDVLSHALESFTARPYVSRARSDDPLARPLSQGANPWSDIGAREALRSMGEHLVRAANDPRDRDARAEVMWAATLAGIAFGNAGVHIPHAMSYAVAGLVRSYRPSSGYPVDEPLVPHGVSVILGAPAAFRATALASPGRHREAARLLGATQGEATSASDAEAGALLAERLVVLMRALGIPNGLAGVGYTRADVPALTARALPQKRLLKNAPIDVDGPALDRLFEASLGCW